MALHLVLCRSYGPNRRFNVSRISWSEEWSTIGLYPQQFPKNIDRNPLRYDVVCSVNGLFCLSYDFGDDELEYVLWNPSTRTFRLVPYPDSTYHPCCCTTRTGLCIRYVSSACCGLGFDAESQDYKFVRFMHVNYDRKYDHYPHRLAYHVAVYSFNNNSWKDLPFPFDRPYQHMYPGGDRDDGDNEFATCVNGFCYWRTHHDVILSFDLSSDNFSTIPYPDDIPVDIIPQDFSEDENVFLLELDGSLGLVIRSDKLQENLFSFCFWVYEGAQSQSQSQWTRKTNLDVGRLAAEKPLWLCNKNSNSNSLVLLLQGLDASLLEYNYSTRELRNIDQIHDSPRGKTMMISPYVELETNIINIAENDDAMDRISQLPDDIKVRILSLLSLKEASSTSVLSTRWSDLWRHMPNLVFHNINHVMLRDVRKYTKCINSIVESHKVKAICFKEFSISLPLNYSTLRACTKWFEFVFSGGVEVLVLNLAGTKFTLLEKEFQRKSSILKSTNLTSLCLKCLEVSGEAIGLLLRNSPLLERLIIKYARLTSDLEVCGGVLKHLDIHHCEGPQLSIKGYAPNLTYLRIDSSLVWDYTQSFIASPLTTLEFTLDCLESCLEKGFPLMPTLRKLIVTYYGCGRRHIIRPITSLLRALPYLEEFEIKQQHWRWVWDGKKGMEVETVNNVERFCHRNFRVFKFTWFNGGDVDHMELMSYILENCDALEKIILHIYAGDSPSHVVGWEYVKQLQSKLPSHIQLITS